MIRLAALPDDVDPVEAAAGLRGGLVVYRANGRHVGEYFDREQARGGTAPERSRVCIEGAISIASGVAPDDLGRAGFGARLALARHLGLAFHARPDDVTFDDELRDKIGLWHDDVDEDTVYREVKAAADALDPSGGAAR